jgi:peroxiredoxin
MKRFKTLNVGAVRTPHELPSDLPHASKSKYFLRSVDFFHFLEIFLAKFELYGAKRPKNRCFDSRRIRLMKTIRRPLRKSLWLTAVAFVILQCLAIVGGANASASDARATPLSLGVQAPDFTLKNHLGETVTLSAAYGKEKTILVFYRGSWCPFCVQQLIELRSLLKAGDGARLYAVSVDPVEKSKKLADKIAANSALEYQILSDPDHHVIDAFGLHDPAYDGKSVDGIPHPTVVIIDKSGRIAWMRVEENYRRRPSNEDIRVGLQAVK